MSRHRVLFLLACAACDGWLGASPTPLPSTPIHVTTTPVFPGGTLTVSVGIPTPASGDLDVTVYGSLAGAGTKPCVVGGAVCGGLSEPIELGRARFFPGMAVTSVDATAPARATPGDTLLFQALVSADAGTVASEVLTVVVGEAPNGARPASATDQAPTSGLQAGRPSAGNVEDCSRAGDAVAVATCQAKQTGDVTLCEDIPIHNDRLYCFAVARTSPGACAQVMDKAMRARCLAEVGAASGATSAGAARASAAPAVKAAGASRPDDCDAETNPDWVLVCKARKGHDVGYCADVQGHDAKLFCYGVLRGSRGSCLQVMNEGLEGECLRAIGAR